MKRILIVGAGDFGREMFCWLTTDRRHGVEWEVVGFLDDNLDALAKHGHYPAGVVGKISEHQPSGDLLVMGIAAPKTRLAIGQQLLDKGGEFLTYIHPSAIVSRFVAIGQGSIVCPQVVISTDARIGQFVTINCTSNIGHDCVIGDGCTINAHCDLTGHTKLGLGVFVGTNVCIVPKVSVGDFASLGAGSTVVRNVKAATTVMGPTAQRLSFGEAEAA